jgi:N-acetylmuramoyl-L-alanine amidase
MHSGRSSGRCAVAEAAPFLRSIIVAGLLLSGATPPAGSLRAQQPVLRVQAPERVHAIEGAVLEGAAAFPAAALQSLGFRLVASVTGLTALLEGDTLSFWTTSPFFRAGSRVQHLSAPVHYRDGVAFLPEQFFIQWLPRSFPALVEYRGGALVVTGSAQAPTPAASATQATAQTRGAVPGAAARGAAAPAPSPRPSGTKQERVVIIDPGHGGRDPGKVGPHGLREKDVTLQISQRLAAVLRERGYEVHLTRTTDTLIALADRPRLANEWRGDRPVAVFLSIHANSAPSTTARGFETFFLSEARTEDERRVAEMENASIRFEEQPVAPADNDLDRILNSLRSDFLTRASHDLAAVMQDKMAAFHPGPNRGVKRAGFYVLVGAIMPAVLIETAFISNRDDAALLGTQSFRQQLAVGIADGVDEFFRRNEHLWVQVP